MNFKEKVETHLVHLTKVQAPANVEREAFTIHEEADFFHMLTAYEIYDVYTQTVHYNADDYVIGEEYMNADDSEEVKNAISAYNNMIQHLDFTKPAYTAYMIFHNGRIFIYKDKEGQLLEEGDLFEPHEAILLIRKGKM